MREVSLAEVKLIASMAAVRVWKPESLATELVTDEVPATLSYERATLVTAPMTWTTTATAEWACNTKPKCLFANLPLRGDYGVPSSLVTHIIDCITDWEGELDDSRLIELMQRQAIADLPEIIQPKQAPTIPYMMNLCILKKGGGKLDIYKHFIIPDRLRLQDAIRVAHGHPYLVDFRGNTRAGIKPFIYMFQRLGGLQIAFARVIYKLQAQQLCAVQAQQLRIKQELVDHFYDTNRRLARMPPILVDDSPRRGSKRKTDNLPRSSSSPSSSSSGSS